MRRLGAVLVGFALALVSLGVALADEGQGHARACTNGGAAVDHNKHCEAYRSSPEPEPARGEPGARQAPPDSDGDGRTDDRDFNDDHDVVPDWADNCRTSSNSQLDSDGDGAGDRCDDHDDTDDDGNGRRDELDDRDGDEVPNVVDDYYAAVSAAVEDLTGLG